jgi:integrase
MDLVFPNTVGKPLEPRAVDSMFKRLLKKAELPTATRFHDLRHTAATLLIERGADLYEVSRLLGHSSITITADIYGHVTQGMKRGLVEKMDSILTAEA